MRKFFATFIFGVLLVSSTLCFAAVDGGKIALGSLFPGMSANALIDACGQPQSKSGDDWHYQNFTAEVERGVVESISTRSNSIMTPDGVRVGQAATVLNSTFGSADKIDHDSDGTEYEFYSTDRTKKIEFTVVNGVIAKISCKIND